MPPKRHNLQKWAQKARLRRVLAPLPLLPHSQMLPSSHVQTRSTFPFSDAILKPLHAHKHARSGRCLGIASACIAGMAAALECWPSKINVNLSDRQDGTNKRHTLYPCRTSRRCMNRHLARPNASLGLLNTENFGCYSKDTTPVPARSTS